MEFKLCEKYKVMNSNNYKKYTLFYSTRCNECKSLLSIIKKNKMENFFHFMCVDNLKMEDIVTLEFSSVPTILYIENNESIIDEGANKCSIIVNNIIKFINRTLQHSNNSSYIQTLQTNKLNNDQGNNFNQVEMTSENIDDLYTFRETDDIIGKNLFIHQ